MTELEEIEQLLTVLKTVKSELIRRDKISVNCREAFANNNVSQKRVQRLNADLNWQCMTYDQRKTDFARLYDKSKIKTGIEEKEYNPSSFHTYKY